MADKTKKNRKEARDKDAANKPVADQTRSDAKRFGESGRRLPLAALGVLLVLIGVGVYFAWPSIQGSMETTPPEDVTASTNLESGAELGPTAPTVTSPDVVVLSERLRALENALAAQSVVLRRTEADLAAATAFPPEPNLLGIDDALARLASMEKRLDEAQAIAKTTRALASGEESAYADAIDPIILERLNTLERDFATIQPEAYTKKINTLQTELASLGSQIAALRQSAEIMDLREVKSGHTMIMVLSFSSLARAASGSAPFAREAEAFSAAARANGETGIAFDNAMAHLAAYALGGTPTHAELAARFDRVALAMIQADTNADDQGWVDATIGRLRRIVTVRRVSGEIVADSLEGRLSSLHQAMSEGDLVGAVALADTLSDKSQRGAKDWLRDVRARLTVEQALTVLETEVTKRVAARWLPVAGNSE